jgi:lipid-A-disaccharide synthase
MQNLPKLQIALVAGEASGDLLASLVIPRFQSRWSELSLVGIGGPRMVSLGFEAWWPQEKLAVRGYVEVLRHYREITSIRRHLCSRLLKTPPNLFMGVDAPDFNLDLALQLRQQGVPTVQFVCPSVWAWRPERMHKIHKCVDHVLCLFPFEQTLLENHGIPATYVGHPLANTIPLLPDKGLARNELKLSPDQLLIALLPGSRTAEIQHLAPRFMSAAILLEKKFSNATFLLPVAPGQMALVQKILKQYSSPRNLKLIAGNSHLVLAAADVAIVASGTATLEAALYKCPMVIAYHMPWLSWQIMQKKRLQPWVGLPNILCQDLVVPELLQEQATPEALAREVISWLEMPARLDDMRFRFMRLHHELRQDTSQRVTYAIEKIIASGA